MPSQNSSRENEKYTLNIPGILPITPKNLREIADIVESYGIEFIDNIQLKGAGIGYYGFEIETKQNPLKKPRGVSK